MITVTRKSFRLSNLQGSPSGFKTVGLIVEFLVMTLQLKRSTRKAAYNFAWMEIRVS